MQRSQFTIRRVMLVVVGCALIFTILRIDEGGSLTAILFYTASPGVGAVVQRWRGGRGILGGVIGGVASYVGYGIAIYTTYYIFPQPDVYYDPGPVLAFTFLSFSGALVGSIVGILVWGCLMPVEKAVRKLGSSSQRAPSGF
jgi:hypothetical protein